MAIEFKGDTSGHHIKLGRLDVSSGLTELTICAWVVYNSFTIGDQRIFSKATTHNEADHWFMLSGNNNTQNRFRLKTGGTVTTHFENTSTLHTGQLYHIGVVYTGSNIIFYRDGQQTGSSSKGGIIDTDASVETWIGDNPGTHRKEFDGEISDVRLYERALSAEEMQTIYALKGKDGIYRGLKHRWTLDESGEGVLATGADTVRDHIGNQAGTPNSSPTYRGNEITPYRRVV